MAFVVAHRTLFLLPSSSPNHKFSFPTKCLDLSHLPSPKPLNLILPTAKRSPSLQISALSSTATPPDTSSSSSSSSNSLLSESTRTVSSILVVAFSISKLFVDVIQRFSDKIGRVFLAPTPDELAMIQNLRGNMACAVGPLFFAAICDQPSGYLNTPLTVVAAGMAKWLNDGPRPAQLVPKHPMGRAAIVGDQGPAQPMPELVQEHHPASFRYIGCEPAPRLCGPGDSWVDSQQ